MTEIILVMNGHMTKSYRKLMYGQINDTKHTKTFISNPLGNSLYLRSVGDLYFFCQRSTSVGRQKCFFFFAQRLKKNFFFRINFDGFVGKPETRLSFFFRPYHYLDDIVTPQMNNNNLGLSVKADPLNSV